MPLYTPKAPSRVAPAAALSDAPLAGGDVHPWPGSYVDLAGWRCHVRTTPATHDRAEPALLVHGLAGSAHNWTEFAGLLRDRLACEAIDLAGHGCSGPAPRGDYRLTAHAERVIGYLEHSGRGPVHLVGNSMGGAISILVAARRPDLVRTLTLVSPAVADNRPRIFPLRHNPRMAAVVVPVLGEALTKRINARIAAEQRVRATIALCFGDANRYPADRLAEAVAETRERDALPWATSAVLKSMRGLATDQLLRGRRGWATMRTVAAPTLVVWGDQDRLVAPDLAPYVAAAIPRARLLELPGVGHTAQMEVPDVTARAVLALVESASPSA